MKLRHAIFALSLLCAVSALSTLSACGGGGGGGGGSDTTQTTIVQGTIENQTAALARPRSTVLAKIREALSFVNRAEAALAGVQVSIRGTDLTTVSDAAGYFRLEGVIARNVIVDFDLPGARVSLEIEAPEGTVVTINQITLNTQDGRATPASMSVDDTTPETVPSVGTNNGNSNTNENDNLSSNQNSNDNDNAAENENENDNTLPGSNGVNSNDNQDDSGNDNSSGSDHSGGNNSNSNDNANDDHGGSNSDHGSDDNGNDNR